MPEEKAAAGTAGGAEEAAERAAKGTVPDLESLERRERPRPAEGGAGLELIHDRALMAAKTAVDMKADEVKILDMHELVTYTDYLVLCTGRNTRLTKRIAEEIAFRLKNQAAVMPGGSEGTAVGDWILLDFLDFVVHIFTPEAREFYRLDVLWKQAPVELVE
ncbi:MAG: ribosome silencing factor [Thermoleophilia bacterium]|nr:ribosome silencing factor [Thermoleophilia bacterium]